MVVTQQTSAGACRVPSGAGRGVRAARLPLPAPHCLVSVQLGSAGLPCSLPPLTCPSFPLLQSLPTPHPSLHLHRLCGNNLCKCPGREEVEEEAARVPGGWAHRRPLSGPGSQGRLSPLGQAMLLACWRLREAVWAAGPGQAWAGSSPLGQPGPLGQEWGPLETQPSKQTAQSSPGVR
jgi:hypothetical protein